MNISKKRLKELQSIKDQDIDYSDIPETDVEFWDKAQVVYPQQKKPITIRIDIGTLQWFKQQGAGYQSKINAVLNAYAKAHRQTR